MDAERFVVRQDAARFHQWQLRTGVSRNRCGPFAIAMAANTLLGEPRLDGDAVAEDLKRRFIEWRSWRSWPRVNRFPPDDATLPGAIAMYLRELGIPATLRAWGNLDALKRALHEKRVGIPIIGEWTHHVGWRWAPWAHALVVVGYTADAVLTLDPAVRSGPDPDLHSHPLDRFVTRWRSMAGLWIEAG